MNEIHSRNRQLWDEELAKVFQDQDEEAGAWRRCVNDPDEAFDSDLMSVVGEFVDEVRNKDVCVLGSGDNHSSFAFAGMGANVTSVDQSVAQLRVAERRAKDLGLTIDFVHSDATALKDITSSRFDLVFTTNGFFVWIEELDSLFSEVHRILKQAGFYFFLEIHPFQRPWTGDTETIEVARSYWDTGPHHSDRNGSSTFAWTVADILNPIADTGLTLRRLRERSAKDASFWEEGKWYHPGEDERLLDWKVNSKAALPTWLMCAAQKA